MAINKECFFSKDGQQQGPVPASMLVQMAKSGQLLATDQAWKDSIPEWVQVSRITRLFPAPVASGPQVKPRPASPPPAFAFPSQLPLQPRANQLNVLNYTNSGSSNGATSLSLFQQPLGKVSNPDLFLQSRLPIQPILPQALPFSKTSSLIPDSFALSKKKQNRRHSLATTCWHWLELAQHRFFSHSMPDKSALF